MAGILTNPAVDITSLFVLDGRDDLSLLSEAMDKGALIDDLARELGASAEARKKWRQRGVPHRWRLPIIELAAERGVELASNDFERELREAS